MSNECFFSGCCDEVLCTGLETWIPLSKLKEKTNKSKTFPHTENFLEVILLRADMFFQHKFDTENVFVCGAHREILLRQVYFYKSISKCDTCLPVRGIVSDPKTDLRHIIVSQAITLFEAFQFKHSYGRLICRQCRTEVSKKTVPIRENLHSDAFACLFDPESLCCTEDPMEDPIEDPMEDSDSDYHPFHDPSNDVEISNEQLSALNSFLAACGSKRKVNVTASYKDLSHRVQLRYVGLVKFIIQSVASLMTRNDPDMLLRDVFSDMSSEEPDVVLNGSLRQVMLGISEAYGNAGSSQSR